MVLGSSKVEYVQTDQFIAATYVKNSKAIGFLWGIFTICYAIISIVIFVQPQWIGSDVSGKSGYFGLWRHCSVASFFTETSTKSEFICHGRLDDFGSILSPSFRSATVFVGLGAIISLLSVFGLILFVCAPSTVAYNIISWMQAISALFISVGLIVFPVGWDSAEVNAMCNNGSQRFYLGSCGFRWAYILAIIGALDGLVLSTLGFILGSRHIKLRDDNSGNSKVMTSSTASRRFFNPADFSTAPSMTSYGSTKKLMNMNMQPFVVLPCEPDGSSEFTRSNEAKYRSEYATATQRFQL